MKTTINGHEIANKILELQPITYKDACEFIKEHHRHHGIPQGHKFSIGLNDGAKVVGVVVIGRPVARGSDDGYTSEVTRLCTDGTHNACSKLYAAAWRASRAMGYRRCITYILAEESGVSLSAAGWICIGQTRGGSWNCPSRPRIDTHPLQSKLLFEVKL